MGWRRVWRIGSAVMDSKWTSSGLWCILVWGTGLRLLGVLRALTLGSFEDVVLWLKWSHSLVSNENFNVLMLQDACHHMLLKHFTLSQLVQQSSKVWFNSWFLWRSSSNIYVPSDTQMIVFYILDSHFWWLLLASLYISDFALNLPSFKVNKGRHVTALPLVMVLTLLIGYLTGL